MPMELVTELPYDHPYRWDGTPFGGPVLWRPSNIGSSLALWLDAEDAASITLNGSTVSQWNDKSGNGRNATQTNAAAQPTFGATLISGKPALSFDGANDVLETASTTINFETSASIFAVQMNTGVSGSIGGTFEFVGGGSYIDVVVYDPTALRWEVGSIPPSNTIAANYHTSLTANQGYVFSSAGNTSAINGGNVKTAAASGTILSPITSKVFVGKYLSTYYTGNIGEVIFLSSVASTADRQKIEGYLAWKWKLQANLPSTHPFKNLPPTV